jgi:hypothetical protein
MTEQQDSAALEREEIATRVANFKATQEKFQRERDRRSGPSGRCKKARKRCFRASRLYHCFPITTDHQ